MSSGRTRPGSGSGRSCAGTGTEARKDAVDRYHAVTAANTEEALNLIRDNPEDPTDVEAIEFVIASAKAGPGDQSYRAIGLARRDHIRDPGMGRVCARLFYFAHAPEAEALMRSVLEQNPNHLDRGRACHALASYLLNQARMVTQVRARPPAIDEYVHERHKAATTRFVDQADVPGLERQAEALLERVVAEFGAIPDWYDQRPLGVIAAGELFARRNLAIGQVAPEITGHDQDGSQFVLSESRGKVVVLTFSGNWCGPCVGMYPQERELVARYAGKPFALLSVNTDADVQTLRAAVAKKEITWRCWWDGGMTGPITSRWGVLSFPSIFVLDPAGVIRFKDVRGDDLDRAVAALIAEQAGH